MAGFLRQATASQSRALGPFLDDSDFITPKTGLTIANTDVKLVVNGAASADKNSGGGTHRVNGVYGFTFDATDTATVGEMEVSIVVSGALIVFDKFTIVEEAVYDAQYAASAPGYVVDQPVNVTKINSVSASSVTTVSANVGTTQPINFTGTGASALAKSDMVDIAGAAVSTSTAQIGVNTVNLGGTAQTGRDIGASVLLSSGTGTGQVKLSSGYVAPNWGDVGNPTTTVNLSGTTIKAVTDAVSATVTSISNGAISAATFAANALDAVWSTATRVLTAATNLTTALATPTNITAGTITTVTNLTNAATAGDFTATMKTSIGTAVAASAVASVTAPVTVAAASIDLIWDEAVDGSVTARQSLRLANSANGGITDGGATATFTIRDLADTKDRVTATVDADGNRSVVTRDLT